MSPGCGLRHGSNVEPGASGAMPARMNSGHCRVERECASGAIIVRTRTIIAPALRLSSTRRPILGSTSFRGGSIGAPTISVNSRCTSTTTTAVVAGSSRRAASPVAEWTLDDPSGCATEAGRTVIFHLCETIVHEPAPARYYTNVWFWPLKERWLYARVARPAWNANAAASVRFDARVFEKMLRR